MNNMKYDIYDKPKSYIEWLLLSLQQLVAVFGATILIPIIIGINPALGLMTAGMGTLIYILWTKKSAVFLGNSGTFIPLLFGLSIGNPTLMIMGVITIGLVYIVIGTIVRFTGTAWVKNILTPVIVGPIIMILGISLVAYSITWFGLDATITSGNTLSLEQLSTLGIATLTFTITTLFVLKGNKVTKTYSIIIGLAISSVVAVIINLIVGGGLPTLNDMGNFVVENPFKSIASTWAKFSFSNVSFIQLVPFIIIAFVSMAEHIGDHTVLSATVNRDLLQDPGLNKTLQAQGLATLTAGLLCSSPVTTYGESTASVAISRVSSKYVVGGAAVLAIIISFTPILTLLAYIPTAVFGGLSLLLYCFIFLNGLKVLLNSNIDFSNQKNLLIVSSMILLGTAVTLIPSYSNLFIGIDVFRTGDISFQLSGLMLPLIIGVLMQTLLPDEEKDPETSV
ncbi:uracil-xanthine permease family protein [Mariniplasma anaerobium]|uniref:Xanthine/uracil permease n=1 Tax=Mariniplasma anaerobium TaxID=2735436 RepID=A0A7U9TJB0_9MOLU|nr:solute carrier family 23 protein [Mariniplasma anaerobium]BCR35231.1 xanthine/uracil permease [Mariniplasma anaerobium]